MELLLDTFLIILLSLSGLTFIFLGAAIAVESSFTSGGTTVVRFVQVHHPSLGKWPESFFSNELLSVNCNSN